VFDSDPAGLPLWNSVAPFIDLTGPNPFFCLTPDAVI